MKKVVCFLLLSALLSCKVQQKASAFLRHHAALADSLLADALDHEAIYTLLDTLKPVSSVRSVRMPFSEMANDLTGIYSTRLDTVMLFQRLCRELSNSQIRFMTVPFREVYNNEKIIEIYAVNLYKLSRKIKEYPLFFTPLGISPETDPVQVITIIENANKYQRWRGYGYLFGYPAYAVNFFVEAGKSQDSTGHFVERDFFQIPVYAGTQGYFTYAIPKGHQPDQLDSSIYYKAEQTLKNYRKIRDKYSSSQAYSAVALWNDWQKSNNKK